MTAPSRQLVAIPEGCDDAQAAGLPLAGLTAWQALVDTAELRVGQRVLVQAAGGGVGHLAVQIARAIGAEVLATAGAGKHDLLADLGADEVFDHREVDVTDLVRDVDVVLAPLGGESAQRAVRTLRPGGIVVVLTGTPPHEAAAAVGVRARRLLVEPDRVGLDGLARLVRAGRLRVVVSEQFGLHEVAAAHRAIEGGHTRGKLVLVP